MNASRRFNREEVLDLPDEWFTRDGDINIPVRYRHPGCSEGKDKALYISRQPNGWSVYCFRCGLKGFRPAGALSPEEAITEQLRQPPGTATKAQYQITLPQDFTPNIPDAGLTWLFNAGITEETIRRYRFGYSHKSDSVVLPIYEGEKLIFIQQRYLGADKARPKYKNEFQRGRKETFFSVTAHGYDSVVIVEDILSCIRVGEVCDCYAVLSAHVPERLIQRLDQTYHQIVLWLDPDKWSKMGKWVMEYRDRGVDIRANLTDRDPKCYTKQEIMDYLMIGEVWV